MCRVLLLSHPLLPFLLRSPSTTHPQHQPSNRQFSSCNSFSPFSCLSLQHLSSFRLLTLSLRFSIFSLALPVKFFFFFFFHATFFFHLLSLSLIHSRTTPSPSSLLPTTYYPTTLSIPSITILAPLRRNPVNRRLLASPPPPFLFLSFCST